MEKQRMLRLNGIAYFRFSCQNMAELLSILTYVVGAPVGVVISEPLLDERLEMDGSEGGVIAEEAGATTVFGTEMSWFGYIVG
jgi:hypothetical protein